MVISLEQLLMTPLDGLDVWIWTRQQQQQQQQQQQGRWPGGSPQFSPTSPPAGDPWSGGFGAGGGGLGAGGGMWGQPNGWGGHPQQGGGGGGPLMGKDLEGAIGGLSFLDDEVVATAGAG